jgi:hypothetical protein
MRTVIDIETYTWANVKHFATVNKLSLNLAVEKLLQQALSSRGYKLEGSRLNG